MYAYILYMYHAYIYTYIYIDCICIKLYVYIHIVLVAHQVWSQCTDVSERRVQGVPHIRQLLSLYYKGKMCSKIDRFAVTMLGQRTDPQMHAQASESRNLVPFVIGVLRDHQEAFG